MRRSVTLELGPFGKEALQRSAQRQGAPPAAIVGSAALHYLSQRDSDRIAVRVPQFARETVNGAADLDPMAVTLELNDVEWAQLSRAAEEEQVTLERLLHHAVILYAADLDQGRVPSRLADD